MLRNETSKEIIDPAKESKHVQTGEGHSNTPDATASPSMAGRLEYEVTEMADSQNSASGPDLRNANPIEEVGAMGKEASRNLESTTLSIAPLDVIENSTATSGTNPSQTLTTPDLLSAEQGPLPDLNSKPYTTSTPPRSSPPLTSTETSTAQTLRVNIPERSPTRSDAGFDERNSTSEDETNDRSEIQSIMDQFGEEDHAITQDKDGSPTFELAGPLLGKPLQHPPRKSSLEPSNLNSSALQSLQDLRLSSRPSSIHQARDPSDIGPMVPPKPGSIHSFGPSRTTDDRFADNPMSPSLHRPPPPEPEPEPDLPFDFHRFLEQLRHRTADPVAKFLRSFLQEFGKKQWMVHEQVKIISDFLTFISNKMAQCEVWREVSDAEFDNAREGMEKLVMNRLYTQTFSPAIPPPQPIPGGKSKRKAGDRLMGPGRRGQHQEDVERDDILAQKVSIYGWIKEEHLDIQPVGDGGKKFLVLAQQGLL